MMDMKWKVFVCALLALAHIQHISGNNNGLYVTNGKQILYLVEDEKTSTGVGSQPHTVYEQEYGRIVGLALDIADREIFWSDISKGHLGLYQARLNDGDKLLDVKRVIDSDIVQVNGLAVDWESKHLYWTDSRKRTIEISDYDGGNRRILGLTGLLGPRGIYCDPVSGYIVWDDPMAKKISRSRPDGSQQEVIIDVDVYLPNQLLIHRSQLYWVDSNDKDVWSAKLDGSSRVKLVSTSKKTLDSNIYGIAMSSSGKLFVSAWERGEILAFSDGNGKDITLESVVPYRLGTAMFSMAYFGETNIQVKASNPCSPSLGKNGCSHLCLPMGPQTARCSCPSYGGKTIYHDGKKKKVPTATLR